MRHQGRRLGAAFAFVTIAVTACGAPPTPPISSSAPQRVSAQAARVLLLNAATKAQSQSVHIAGTMRATMTGTGDFAPYSGQTTTIDLTADVASSSSLSGQLVISLAGRTVTEQIVMVGGTIYASIAGGAWRTVTTGVDASSGTDSLSAGLQYLESVGTVTDEGPGTVGGVSVENFQATLDPAKMSAVLAKRFSSLGGSSQQALQRLASALSFQGGTINAAIDGSGRLVHLSGTVDGSMDLSKVVPGKIGIVTYHETIDMAYSNYGEPVTVTPPPGA